MSQMTEDSLVYTNLLIYSPVASPAGIVRMDQAVIPIECHYGRSAFFNFYFFFFFLNVRENKITSSFRKYSLSSSSLKPTWIPFTSTQSAVETLVFDLKIMSSELAPPKSGSG